MPSSQVLESLRQLVAAVCELEKVDTSKVLSGAPFLTNWHAVQPTPSYVELVGMCSGHPRLRDGHISTSRVLYIDPGLAWARTASRYYRLGDRAPTDLGDGMILTQIDGKPIRSPHDLQSALQTYREAILMAGERWLRADGDR